MECPSVELSTTSNVGLSCTKEKGSTYNVPQPFSMNKRCPFYSENKPLTILILGGKDEAESTEIERQAAKETKS